MNTTTSNPPPSCSNNTCSLNYHTLLYVNLTNFLASKKEHLEDLSVAGWTQVHGLHVMGEYVIVVVIVLVYCSAAIYMKVTS